MRVDIIATESHYADHLAPIWRALAPEERGIAYIPERLRGYAESLGIHRNDTIPRGGILLAASWGDVSAASNQKNRKMALMEHGIGQSYVGRHPAYVGGAGRGFVDLFLSPNERAAAIERAAYPRAAVEVIGSPYLDTLDRSSGPSVFDAGFSFHWRGGAVAPEAGSTAGYWADAIEKLGKNRAVLGHAHPRDRARAKEWFENRSIPFFLNLPTALSVVKVFVCDNSSAMYYAAALGIPVLVLNSPTYRRYINHGLRFWEYSDVGIQVDRPALLADALTDAMAHSASVTARAVEISDALFPYRGYAAERAVVALLGLVN